MVYGALPMVLKFLWPFFVLLKQFFFFFMTCPFLLFIIQSTGWEVGNVLVS